MRRCNTNFQQYDADSAHQRLAGLASWAAFSARWRARQGLPLLHPMDVQFLTPQDFRNGLGRPLSPTEQRRLFRKYVQAALRVAPVRQSVVHRAPLEHSGDLAYARADGFCRSLQVYPDLVYGGRADVRPYEHDALLPPRPYGIPTTSPTFEGYWLDGTACVDDEDG
ncbi:MAG: hypothetical protein ACR2H5_25525 [Ktedonobacteraceae bacterium]